MFKKILVVLLLGLFMSSNVFGAVDWDKSEPAGSTNASDIDYWVATTNNESLDRLLSNSRENCAVYFVSTASVGIKTGQVVCSNSAGTLRQFRSNTSVVALTWADIDTGAEENSTTYYVYAVADADATTFTGTISKSASTPTGKTYYKKLGSFYNDSSGNILNDDSLINYNNYYALKLGDWVAKSNNTVYQASTDGFVVATTIDSSSDLIGYTDSSNPPTTIRLQESSATGGNDAGFTMPVKKGDYYKITGATTSVYWIPLEKEI